MAVVLAGPGAGQLPCTETEQMKKPVLLPLSAAILLALGAQGVNGKTSFEAEAEAGLEYDSTLSVEELDRTVDQSDTARLLRGKLNAQWEATENLTLKGGYSDLGRNYRDNSEFDLAIHQGFGDLSYDFDLATLGASHYLAHAELDDRDFLTLNQTSVYASRLFDQRLFVRVAANVRDKAFEGRPQRDADNVGVEGDVYLFFNGAKSFVSLGLSADGEDAKDPQFDYDGMGLKAKAQNTFTILGKDSKVALSHRYVDRDYDHVTPEIGALRDDRRHTTRLEWEVAMMPHLDIVSAVEYGHYDSNLDSVNYSESLASIALRLKL